MSRATPKPVNASPEGPSGAVAKLISARQFFWFHCLAMAIEALAYPAPDVPGSQYGARLTRDDCNRYTLW
jgi:hypothetical protein